MFVLYGNVIFLTFNEYARQILPQDPYQGPTIFFSRGVPKQCLVTKSTSPTVLRIGDVELKKQYLRPEIGWGGGGGEWDVGVRKQENDIRKVF